MFLFPPTIILRHRKENLKKCSLKGLETRPDMRFFTYPKDPLPPMGGYLLLALDAPPLSEEDRDQGLFLIDGTWRYAEVMLRQVPTPHNFTRRSIPARFQTAYPRCQAAWVDPEKGLASVEALYIAYHLLGRDTAGLMDNYHWREVFLQKNSLSY